MAKLPNFKVTIDQEYSENGENLGVEMIANTANPAIRIMGMAFNSNQKQLSFSDNLKYRIAGPIMVPGDIYRCDNDGFEYEVNFSVEEIERIHSKFMQSNKSKEIFNEEHDATNVVPSFILEAFLVDSEAKIDMIKAEYNLDVPMGTSFVVQQFTDKDAYNKIVSEGKTAFSIEGFLGLKLSEHKNNNINKKEKMEEKLGLPAGEYVMGDKIYVVAEDGTFVIKEKEAEVAMAEEVKEEEIAMAEEVKVEEEALAEAPVLEDAPVADVYTKEEVDAKFEELYKTIADLQLEESTEVEEEVAPVALNVNSKFSALDNMRLFFNK